MIENDNIAKSKTEESSALFELKNINKNFNDQPDLRHERILEFVTRYVTQFDQRLKNIEKYISNNKG